MIRAATRIFPIIISLWDISQVTVRAGEQVFQRREDVIYGRKVGTALTMDIFTPVTDAKGIGVIMVVSGGFRSSHDGIKPALVAPLAGRGFTVFAVVHGSQPRFT